MKKEVIKEIIKKTLILAKTKTGICVICGVVGVATATTAVIIHNNETKKTGIENSHETGEVVMVTPAPEEHPEYENALKRVTEEYTPAEVTEETFSPDPTFDPEEVRKTEEELLAKITPTPEPTPVPTPEPTPKPKPTVAPTIKPTVKPTEKVVKTQESVRVVTPEPVKEEPAPVVQGKGERNYELEEYLWENGVGQGSNGANHGGNKDLNVFSNDRMSYEEFKDKIAQCEAWERGEKTEEEVRQNFMTKIWVWESQEQLLGHLQTNLNSTSYDDLWYEEIGAWVAAHVMENVKFYKLETKELAYNKVESYIRKNSHVESKDSFCYLRTYQNQSTGITTIYLVMGKFSLNIKGKENRPDYETYLHFEKEGIGDTGKYIYGH